MADEFFIWNPDSVSFFAHALEEFAHDFFFVPEMEVEIAGADFQIFGDVIRGNRNGSGIVEEFDGRKKNSFSVLSAFHE